MTTDKNSLSFIPDNPDLHDGLKRELSSGIYSELIETLVFYENKHLELFGNFCVSESNNRRLIEREEKMFDRYDKIVDDITDLKRIILKLPIRKNRKKK